VELQGTHTATGFRFAIIVSRFNEDITEGLLAGAREALAQAAVDEEDVTVVRVPGAFEIPITAQRLTESGRFDAVICLGCLIKGDTMHFEYIATAASHGIMDVSMSTGVPVAFGVLTTLTEEQAVERSKPGADNKGREAALAAIEMVTLLKKLDEGSIE
jgi:6,7-dimethyl-8-ribityllumazine synthase